MTNSKKKFIAILILVLVVFAVLFLNSIYAFIQTPATLLKYKLNANDFCGTFTFEELCDGNDLYLDKIRDYRQEEYIKYTLDSDDMEVLTNILSKYTYKTAYIDYSLTGSIRHPKNQIVMYTTNNDYIKNLSSKGNDSYSYGITSITLMDNCIKINRGVVLGESIDSFPTQTTSFNAIDTGIISYYSKDPNLVKEIKIFYANIVNTN